MRTRHDSPAGPTEVELAAIEREMPLIEAEIQLLDAQIRMLTIDGRVPGPIDWRRLRRAEHHVLRIAAQRAATVLPPVERREVA